MPHLNFLKKIRTKDSAGSAKDSAPPTTSKKDSATGPSKPQGSQTSDVTSGPSSRSTDGSGTSHSATTTATSAADSNTAKGGEMASTLHQISPASTQPGGNQNIASIQNLLNKDTGSQQTLTPHQEAGKTTSTNGGVLIPGLAGHAPHQQMRATKGKYTLNDFDIQRTLGTGSFGRVHLVKSHHNQRFYAMKVLKKAQVVKMKQVEHTNDERRTLQRVKHPFLITLWGTFQDSRNLYMVMDFVEGGELFSLLRKSQVNGWRCSVTPYTF